MKNKKHLNEEGFLSIIGLRSNLNLGLSETLKKAFPNYVSYAKPEYIFNGIPNPFWLAGFSSGDGSFYIRIRSNESKISNKINRSVVLAYQVTLHPREENLLKGILIFLREYSNSISFFNVTTEVNNLAIKNSLNLNVKKSKNSVSITVSKFSEIFYLIIPFFEKYGIKGQKSLDFEDFKKIAQMIKNKDHLKLEGFNQIIQINSNMNQRRP